jgi:hypothetical protein
MNAVIGFINNFGQTPKQLFIKSASQQKSGRSWKSNQRIGNGLAFSGPGSYADPSIAAVGIRISFKWIGRKWSGR